MIDFVEAHIESLVVHRVGNKLRDEGIFTSPSQHPISHEEENVLLTYFLRSLPGVEILRFHHSSDLRLNELFTYCQKIFLNSSAFLPQSVNILKHLYACSEHPKIQSGDVFFAYLSGVGYSGRQVPAIGVFKTERTDSFLRVTSQDRALRVRIEKGANLKAPDKGCLILQSDESDGYRVLCLDKDDETRYWRNRFLNLVPLPDDQYITKGVLAICQTLCDQPSQTACKTERISLANRAVDYFVDHEIFDPEDFAQKVLKTKELSAEFLTRKKRFEKENSIAPIHTFPISKPLAKVAKRALKNLIKLDTKMELRLKFIASEDPSEYLERGFDKAKRMYFYKIYFNKET
jgi:hypothetical protein